MAGLPKEYAPIIMGMESSGVKITCDSNKTKVLQDIKKPVGSSAFFSKTKKKSDAKMGFRCFNCNRFGHKAADCNVNKGNKSKKQVGFCTVFVAGATNKDDWFVDSGASMHMSMRKDWFNQMNERRFMWRIRRN